LQETTPKHSFFVGMNDFVTITNQKDQGPQDEETIQKHLQKRWPHLDLSQARETGNPNDTKVLDLHVLALPIREQIDRQSQFGFDERPVINAKGGPSGREERLWRYDQELHENIESF